MHQPDLWEAYMTAQILALWGRLLWSWSSSQEQPIQLAKATNKLPNSRKRKWLHKCLIAENLYHESLECQITCGYAWVGFLNGGGKQLLQPDYTLEVHGTAVNQTGCEAEIGHATIGPVKRCWDRHQEWWRTCMKPWLSNAMGCHLWRLTEESPCLAGERGMTLTISIESAR